MGTSGAKGARLLKLSAGADARARSWMGSHFHDVRITKPIGRGYPIRWTVRPESRRFSRTAGYLTEAERDGKGGYGWDKAK